MAHRTLARRPSIRRGLGWTSACALAASLATAGTSLGNALEPQVVPAGGNDSATPPRQSGSAARIVPLAPRVDDAEADKLILRLADPSWPVRREAQQKLIDMGPAALPAIARARQIARDPQTQASLELVEEGIARAVAERGRRVFVSLDGADATEAVREIARQAGVEIRVDEWTLRGENVDAHLAGLGWWEATLDLCSRYDLDVRVSPTSTTFVRAALGDGQRTLGGPLSVDGPLLVLARGATYQRSVDFSGLKLKPLTQADQDEAQRLARRGTRFRYDFEALLEPRFQLGPKRFDVIVTRAVDDAGNVLLNSGAADGADLGRELAGPQIGGSGQAGMAAAATVVEGQWLGGRLRFEVDLRFPENPGHHVNLAGRIRGVAGADLYDLKESGESLGTGTEWRIADEQMLARLEPSATPGRWMLVVQSARPVLPEVADVIVASLNGVELSDIGGERFRRGTFNSHVADDGRLKLRVEFIGDADGTMAPTRLACRVPRRAVELDVPFQFDGLPMP